MSDFLKPCPCCGGQAFLLINRLGFDGCMYVECSDCGLGTPELLYDLTPPTSGQVPRPYAQAYHDVTCIWNRRTILQPVPTTRRRRSAPLEGAHPPS